MTESRIDSQIAEPERASVSYSSAFCGYCGERLLQSTTPITQCPYCDMPFRDARPRPAGTAARWPTGNVPPRRERRRSEPALAAVLSAVLPGSGQIYNGQFFKGLFVFCTCWLVIPWLFGILDAYVTASRTR